MRYIYVYIFSLKSVYLVDSSYMMLRIVTNVLLINVFVVSFLFP